MRVAAFIVFGVAFTTIAGTSAFAFEEQPAGGGAIAPQETAPAAPGEKVKDLNLNVPSPSGGDAGTEVRIPGLGKLGVLPKMDFGLELLYGANDSKQPEATPDDELSNGDLTIRGTVKHNF